jgi:Fe-Mn family superoxide dismutase
VAECVKDFAGQAVANFGSGWTWLARSGNDVVIFNTSNAGNPLTNGYQPLLTVDVWEHAYYVDYRNARAKYVENFSSIINWDFVSKNFAAEHVTLGL